MIVVKLWGGMCNQMFQYAFGYAMSRKYNDELFFDIDFFKNQPKNCGKRELILDKYFYIPSFSEYKRTKFISLLENRYVNYAIRLGEGFKCNLPGNIYFFKEKPRCYYNQIPYKSGKINYYDGYWQTEEYFKEYADDLRQIFQPKIDLTSSLNNFTDKLEKNSVAIHIRRGDYLNSGNMPGGYIEKTILEYYLRAIDEINYIIKFPVFYVFSDDIPWCKKIFESKQISINYVENGDEFAALTDLFCISMCENGIMSPSTFSWWGNWLRKNVNKSIVMAPRGIYNNEKFLLDSWVNI